MYICACSQELTRTFGEFEKVVVEDRIEKEKERRKREQEEMELQAAIKVVLSSRYFYPWYQPHRRQYPIFVSQITSLGLKTHIRETW